MSKAAVIANETRSPSTWSSTQAYVLAVFCLVLGVALGYLFRGSASPSATVSADAQPASTGEANGMPPGHPDPAQQKAALDKAAGPLVEALQNSPNDLQTIVQLGNLFYDGKQYPQAIEYYERAVKIDGNNADVRTDLGTSYWYSGNADAAIAEFEKSLKIRPDHPGALFNLGIVKWQGKSDPAGAASAWEELLKRNPNYPQKQQIEGFISKAKEHAKG